MFEVPEIELRTTDGEIAVMNLESAGRRSWSKFFEDPIRDGTAETVVEHEQLLLQFIGDPTALDRVEFLGSRLAEADAASARAALIQAHVASMAHRFSDARRHLARAEVGGAPAPDIDRLRLSIDQACGTSLDVVLDARRRNVIKTRGLEDYVALASLLADLGDFSAAERTYKDALPAYQDVSPFPVARVCFQLGMLWGELVPEPDLSEAAQWYRRAIALLPMYTKARVHLAEICSSEGRLSEAEALLRPVVAIGNPEVDWRLADVLAGQGKFEESVARMTAARAGFESLLERHLLAFADHGAEFYAGSGTDFLWALQLARVNADNRPTMRAFEQAHEIAIRMGDTDAALKLLADAAKRWGGAAAFLASPLSERHFEKLEGAAT